MILCIDTKCLDKDSDLIQKPKNIYEILAFNLKYFETEEEAYSKDYAPLKVSLSVRSTYTNKVLQIAEQGTNTYFIDVTNIDILPHKGLDLVMYLVSQLFLSNVGVIQEGINDIMFNYSAFMLIGIYYDGDCTPIIYSHIVLSDEGTFMLEPLLKEGRNFVPIKDIDSKGHVEEVLLSTLFDIEKGETDEKYDYN